MRGYCLPTLMLLAACGSQNPGAPTNAASPPDMEVATDLPAVSPQAPAEPPRDVSMPDFAPRYPGSTLVAVASANVGGAQNHEVRLTTLDDAASIMDFYRSSFAAAGLRKTSDFLSGGSGMMSGIGKGRKASIAITREADHQAIIVTYSGD